MKIQDSDHPIFREPTSELEGLPPLSTELVAVLEKQFQLVNPKVDETMADIQRRAGQQDVLAFIRRLERKRPDVPS